MRIKTTAVFHNLCRIYLHQDFDLFGSTSEELAANMAKDLGAAEITAIGPFLDKLLSGRYATADIADVWKRNMDGSVFRNAKAAYALTALLRDAIEAEQQSRKSKLKLKYQRKYQT